MVSLEVLKGEKRTSRRKLVRISAVLNYQGINYPGMVENISESGLYMILADRNMVDLSISSVHNLTLLSGEKRFKISCRTIWSYPTPPYGLTTSVGMEIINPPTEFIEYLREIE